MKKIKMLLASLLFMFIATATFAETDNAIKQNAANQTQSENDQIIVYSAPNDHNILEKVPADAGLIPIYHQKDWIKVGDPRNGQVGWVNRQQVRKAREAFFRPDIQTVYIHSDRAKDGKPQLNIVAYKNGKKLSPEQAKRLYEKIRKNQMSEMRRMNRMTSWLDQQFTEMMPAFQPMIVLPATPAKAEQTQQQSPKAKISHPH